MKAIFVLFVCIFFSFSSFANNSNSELAKVLEPQQKELKNLIISLFANQTDLAIEEDKKLKIIIMNSDFRKVRVGEVENLRDLNAESTLVPVIYRSEFVTKIHNVSYYILKD